MSDLLARTCVTCRHFIFYAGEPDYSEHTLGHDCEIICGRGVWKIDVQEDYTDTIRAKFLMAGSCQYFEDATCSRSP